MRSGGIVHGPDAVARQYASTRDPAARDALVGLCEPLVRGVASDYDNPGLHDDLVQEGYLGLLNAIDRYDPSRGTPFLAFARHFVRGEISHHVRDHRWVIRRPRWMDRVFGRIEQVVAQSISERGRYPGVAGLAESLEVDTRSVAEILKTGQAMRTLSLEDGGREDLARSQRQQEALECSPEDRLVLIDALEKLRPRQRTVVFYLYFADLRQAEVARLLGISQKHVSRVLAGALLRLRQALTPLPPRG